MVPKTANLESLQKELWDSLSSELQIDRYACKSQGKRKQARAVLLRILQIGSAVGVIVGLMAFAGKSAVSTIFTKDLLVSGEVQRVLPMVALFMVSLTCLMLCSCQHDTQGGLSRG